MVDTYSKNEELATYVTHELLEFTLALLTSPVMLDLVIV